MTVNVKVSRHQRKPVRDGTLVPGQQVGVCVCVPVTLCVAGAIGSVVIKDSHIFCLFVSLLIT